MSLSTIPFSKLRHPDLILPRIFQRSRLENLLSSRINILCAPTCANYGFVYFLRTPGFSPCTSLFVRSKQTCSRCAMFAFLALKICANNYFSDIERQLYLLLLSATNITSQN
jgi:hypothetical protein